MWFDGEWESTWNDKYGKLSMSFAARFSQTSS